MKVNVRNQNNKMPTQQAVLAKANNLLFIPRPKGRGYFPAIEAAHYKTAAKAAAVPIFKYLQTYFSRLILNTALSPSWSVRLIK